MSMMDTQATPTLQTGGAVPPSFGEAFKVWFKIRDSVAARVYYDTLRVSDLAPNTDQVVSFRDWPFPHPLGR